MKNVLFGIFISIFLVWQGCDKPPINSVKKDYYYYTTNFKKTPIYLKDSEVYVSFLQDTVNKEEAQNILSKYPYFTDSLYPIYSLNIPNYNKLLVDIKPKETLRIDEILKTLNQDPNIDFATPVFTSSLSGSGGRLILLNEIICDPYGTKEALEKLISGYHLSIIKSKSEYPVYILKVQDINNGFEALEIANRLYETQKFHYCEPNFLMQIEFFNSQQH